MAVQSHAKIMQLLSVGPKGVTGFSCSGTRHRNAQIINNRRRHGDTGSKFSLSHYLYMLHLCVVHALIQAFHAERLSRTVRLHQGRATSGPQRNGEQAQRQRFLVF